MAKPQVAPVHVRLPPETLDHLRELAANRGDTVHAEVVRAVEELLAREWGVEPEIIAMNVVAESLVGRFKWAIGTAPEARRDLIQLVRTGFYFLFDRLLDSERIPEPLLRLGEAGGLSVWAEMQRQGDTPLGEAARALGLEKLP